MDKQKLETLLKELHAELGRAEAVDEASRAALHDLSKEIRDLLKRGEHERRAGYRSLLDRLNESIVQFEGAHPTLALAITQVINALVDIGV